MTSAGVKCILARDLTDAETSYNPILAFTPDMGTEKDIADVERSGIPTINIVGEMRKAGAWNDHWIVEKVRVTPWGTNAWPYEFTDSVKVTLSAPQQKGVAIRYTLDGENPGPASPLYTKPLDVTKTTRLHAAAFENGRLASTTHVAMTRTPLPTVTAAASSGETSEPVASQRRGCRAWRRRPSPRAHRRARSCVRGAGDHVPG